ncbi:Holliday junction resolvase RuvX [Arthrobacter agilis]|jgi:putative Holliday junction resolvase|uniref:Holliday junction resolvase RuvX n=1 Tax=Arthrobacter agilis TaxID=37921 RepID=UPI0027841309|nr:Holliday junction resolvase RuvX [Arthrobacter agilis]MDQ0735043.1 putative Holliday junction resolvase [Arthrobacter agilis]
MDAPAPYPRGPKLGVDVGQVRVGLAGCDRDGLLATPIRTLKRDARKNSDVRILVREAVERGAVQIVVGLPRNLSGREGASAEMARTYAALVVGELQRQALPVPVRLVDERLSTVSAHRSLHAAGLSSREHRKVVDQVAAVEILQHAIDTQRSLGRDVGDPVPVRDAEGAQGPLLTPTEEPVIKDSSPSRRNPES